MKKIILCLVGSAVAFSLSGCAVDPVQQSNNPAIYIPPQTTESHML